MPKLWNDTVEAHRREVRDAILDTTAALVREHGLLAVTMSQIAARTGIGRATLYKYFSDVQAILIAWHDRHVTAHLDQLAAISSQAGEPGTRLEAVLGAYARIAYERARHDLGADLSALVHHDEHVTEAEQRLHRLVRDLIAVAADAGHVRTDIPPAELARYCLYALSAAAGVPGRQALDHLITLTLTGLRPAAGE